MRLLAGETTETQVNLLGTDQEVASGDDPGFAQQEFRAEVAGATGV